MELSHARPIRNYPHVLEQSCSSLGCDTHRSSHPLGKKNKCGGGVGWVVMWCGNCDIRLLRICQSKFSIDFRNMRVRISTVTDTFAIDSSELRGCEFQRFLMLLRYSSGQGSVCELASWRSTLC